MAIEKKSPKVRFDGFTEDWETDSFKNLTTINQGLQISITNRFKKKIPDSHFYITNEFLKEGAKSEYYILNPSESVLCTKDDVLMTRTGNTGEVVTGVTGAFHNNFFKIKFDREKIDKDYLVYFLKNEATQSLILRLAGVSTIPDLNHNDFYQIEMSFPKIEEQNKISQLLENLDSLITNHQTQLLKLKNLKKAMLTKMFPQNGANVPEIRFKGFYGEWKTSQVGLYYDFKNGLNKGKEFFGYGKPIINFTDVFHNRELRKGDLNGRVDVTIDELKNYGVKKGDLFFTRTSEKIEEIGFTSVMLDEPKDAVFSGFVLRARPIDNDPLNNLFKKYVFNTEIFRSEMIKKSSMTTRALTSGTAIKKMFFSFPEKHIEQEKIGQYFTSVDKLISNHLKQLKKLNNIKKACLSKLFVA